MKYLKRFENYEDITIFSRNYLASLLDNGFNFEVWVLKEYDDVVIRFGEKSIYSGRGREFRYNDIKDDFIPYIKVLSDNYSIINILFETPYSISSGIPNITSVIDILNNSVINYSLLNVHIQIRKET